MFPSSFTAKLGTNYCPRDDEVAEIKALLVEPDSQLKRLDDEIAHMQKSIDKLSEERDRLRAYVEAHRILTSPIRRLPLDLLEEIFMTCIPTHRNCVMSAEEAPVILGRICSSWRTISLSTPRLWSRLHIVEPTRAYGSNSEIFEAKVAQRLEITATWLRRSGACPLSISLESTFDDGIPPPLTQSPTLPDTGLFLRALVPFASRWQNVRLGIPASAFKALESLSDQDVPLLTHLKIVQRSEHPDTHYQWGPSSILHGSNLSHFSIAGRNFNSLDFPLRWNQLTALSIMGSTRDNGHSQTIQAVVRILSRCPELRSCKLLVRENLEGQSADLADSTVECPFLHTMDLVCAGAPVDACGRLLGRLFLPALRRFKFRGQGSEPEGATPESLASGLVSSLTPSTRLEAFDLDSSIFTKASLNILFRGLPPTIRRLQISDFGRGWHPMGEQSFHDDALAIFNPSPDHPSPPCPALQEIFLTHCRMLSDDALLRFITSRMTSPSCGALKRVEARFNREIQTDILPSLQPFVDSGLQLHITHISPVTPQFSPWLGLTDGPAGFSSWMSPDIF
ncbi:hypothetical protein DFH09DRAFT_1206937, partial [Mycena vulgaris]